MPPKRPTMSHRFPKLGASDFPKMDFITGLRAQIDFTVTGAPITGLALPLMAPHMYYQWQCLKLMEMIFEEEKMYDGIGAIFEEK